MTEACTPQDDEASFHTLCRHKEAAVCSDLLHAVARPLMSNLLRDITNDKFHQVKTTSKLLTRAESTVGTELVALVMRRLCFRLVTPVVGPTHASDLTPATSSSPAPAPDGTWVFGTPDMSMDERKAAAVKAEQWLSEMEDSLLALSKAIHRPVIIAGGGSLATVNTADDDDIVSGKPSSTRRREDEQNASNDNSEAFLALGEKRRMQQQVERREAAERLHARQLADAREKAAADARELAEATALQQGISEDKQAVAHLEAVARSTLHNTGRLRNASFEAKHFQLRAMRHGRAFACTSCPPDAIEAHWHVINGSLLYAYCVHLSSDASKVLHLGYEHAYQYNTIPGTEHFGRTVWMTTKHIDETTGQIALLQHHTKAVDRCVYCNEEFRLLFL